MTEDERFDTHEQILRSLAAMLAEQHARNTRQDAMNERMAALHERQVEFNQEVKITLARIETLLARMLQPGQNGH